MSKGKKRRQKGEYTRQRPSPPDPAPILPPAKAVRLRQGAMIYMLLSSLVWLWEVEDVEDVPILRAATAWFDGLRWPETEEEFWTGPTLLERKSDGPASEEGL